jgi:hypothetical protein
MVIFLLVLLIQVIVVAIDNYSHTNLFFTKLKSKKTASAYTSRSKLLLCNRTIFFITPPLLGYLVTNQSLDEIMLIFLLAAFLTFFITLVQYFIFFKKNEMKLFVSIKDSVLKNYKTIYFYIGLLAFSIFLMSPFILNFLAALLPKYSLLLVQMNPFITSLSTFYVTLYMDPKISKKVDFSESFSNELLESITVRLLGRLLVLIASVASSFFLFHYF